MRVTGRMLRQTILLNVNSSKERLQLAQTQLATGKRILKPSDEPLDLTKSIRARAVLTDNRQYIRNIEDAISWIENTEPAVDDMVLVITELKETAIAGSSDNKTAAERAVLAQQVDGLIERLVELANTTHGGKFVFAGTYTTTPPYITGNTVSDEAVTFPGLEFVDLAHTGITEGTVTVSGLMGETYVEGVDYEIDCTQGVIRRLSGGAMGSGDTYFVSYETDATSSVSLNVPDTDGDLLREIAPGYHEKINVGGQEILDSQIDVFGLLMDVKNRLIRDRTADVGLALVDIDDALDQITTVLSKHGMRYNAFELAQNRLEIETVNLEALISGYEDADMAEVMIRFETEQMAYESALAAAAEIMNTSLINFIG